MTGALTFGIFDWLDDARRGLAETWEQRLRMLGHVGAGKPASAISAWWRVMPSRDAGLRRA